jgi:hypothetical protein
MARRSNGYGAALVVGLATGAVLLAASSAKSEREGRRAQFRDRLRKKLNREDFEVRSLTFGRGPANEPVWLVTVRDGTELRTERVPLGRDADPYEDAQIDHIVARFA